MRLIDADALKERIRKALGIKSFDNLLPSEKTIVKQIDMASTIRPEPHWIPVTERLPKIEKFHTSKTCLVYCKIGEEGDWDYIYDFAELEENIFGQVGWSCERDDEYHEPLGEVIAWTPLPEPYKGVTE